jgi:hypothetical protein
VTSVGYGDGMSMPAQGFVPFHDNNNDFLAMLVCMLFGTIIFSLPQGYMTKLFDNIDDGNIMPEQKV